MADAAASYAYPFAASPDIIRSHQKDAYFQGILLEQLSSVLRRIYGARFAHTHTTEARTASELLYLGLTTLIGNRTLGEEYCDIVQIEDDTLRLPTLSRRAAYIFGTILVPYGLNRILPLFRQRLRSKLEASLRRAKKPASSSVIDTRIRRIQQYLLDNLDTITSPAPIYAVSLATFYFSGAYYHLGKRLMGLRYIFTRSVEATDARVGYELLGVLLVLQMAVQAYLHLHTTAAASLANTASLAGSSALLDHGVEVSLNPHAYSTNNALLFESTPPLPSVAATSGRQSEIAKMTNTPVSNTPQYDLANPDTMAWIDGKQQRKCTLCLEEMKDPSVTTCGHVFCWTCIGDWCREKPECPLCRQACLAQHILALRG